MSEDLLVARNISKRFTGVSGNVEVLKEVNLTLKKGKSISIRGESGSGKSTLLNILGGLEKPDTGTVHWEDNDIAQMSSSKLSSMRATFLGFVFQAYYLIPELNAMENVLIPSRIANTFNSKNKTRAKELLERVGLKERVLALPQTLSGGERQRIAIARALINKPSVILADEPTGNLDEKTGDIVLKLMLKLCEEENSSLVLVTHNPLFSEEVDGKTELVNGEMSFPA